MQKCIRPIRIEVSARHFTQKCRIRTLECGVNLLDHIGREYQNALVVFDLSQEDRDKSVPRNIDRAPGLHEDVCFVQEENRVPQMCELQDLIQPLVDRFWLGTQLSGADNI